MKEIPLAARRRCSNTGKYVAIVDDCDYEAIHVMAWSPLVIRPTGVHGLVYACYGSPKKILMHRLIWKLAHGDDAPAGFEIDHIEHGLFGGLDNRRCNLRLATRHQQFGNTRKKAGTVSLYRGVYWHRKAGKWAAQIAVGDSPKYLGLFEVEEDAGLAYDAAAAIYFGEFARLNFPLIGAA